LFLLEDYNEAPGLAGLFGAVPGLYSKLPLNPAEECLFLELLKYIIIDKTYAEPFPRTPPKAI
jgi:hypothetical protein